LGVRSIFGPVLNVAARARGSRYQAQLPRPTKNPDVNEASRVPDSLLIPVSCIAIVRACYVI
jgi:hypothetical protein